MSKKIAYIKGFFNSCIWLSVLLILVSIIIDQNWVGYQGIIKPLIVGLISNFGVALLVSTIFSFKLGTSDFMRYISKILEGIIVKGDFVTQLNSKAKTKLISRMLRPLNGKLDKYYEFCIQRALEAVKYCVRTQYTSHCRVFFSPETNAILAEYINTYRLHPGSDGYEEIIVGFHDQDPDAVVCEKVTLTFGNHSEVYNPDRLKTCPAVQGVGNNDHFRRIPIPEAAKLLPSIEVKVEVLQRGYDHWIQIGVVAMQPMDGFNFIVDCESPLIIRDEAIFIQSEFTLAPLNIKGEGRATISGYGFIEKGAGVAVVIDVPHEIDPSSHEKLRTKSQGARRNGKSIPWKTPITPIAILGETAEAKLVELPMPEPQKITTPNGS